MVVTVGLYVTVTTLLVTLADKKVSQTFKWVKKLLVGLSFQSCMYFFSFCIDMQSRVPIINEKCFINFFTVW